MAKELSICFLYDPPHDDPDDDPIKALLFFSPSWVRNLKNISLIDVFTKQQKILGWRNTETGVGWSNNGCYAIFSRKFRKHQDNNVAKWQIFVTIFWEIYFSGRNRSECVGKYFGTSVRVTCEAFAVVSSWYRENKGDFWGSWRWRTTKKFYW